MKEFWLRLVYIGLERVLGSAAWQEIDKNIRAAEEMNTDGAAKKRYVEARLNWLLNDLRKGFSSSALRFVAHILFSVAIDLAVAKMNLETKS